MDLRKEGHADGVAFPSLREARRSYHPAHEADLFTLARVDAYLAGWRWERTVDRSGQIALANRNHRVGTSYYGRSVRVQFEPTTRACVGRLIEGTEVLRTQLVEFEADHICGRIATTR
jgi:hypothetical protein